VIPSKRYHRISSLKSKNKSKRIVKQGVPKGTASKKQIEISKTRSAMVDFTPGRRCHSAPSLTTDGLECSDSLFRGSTKQSQDQSRRRAMEDQDFISEFLGEASSVGINDEKARFFET
jgi:hypothetical protein